MDDRTAPDFGADEEAILDVDRMPDPATAEASEADLLEQRELAVPIPTDDAPSADPEVPEADALEQARAVPDDDDFD